MIHRAPINVTKSINLFRDLLNASWEIAFLASSGTQTGSFMDDWLEANWEFIVESSISPVESVTLEPYGDGADCNINSSRVWNALAVPTHRIYLNISTNPGVSDALNGGVVEGRRAFDRFCSFDGNWFHQKPPFDHVLLQSGRPIVVAAKGLSYIADRI